MGLGPPVCAKCKVLYKYDSGNGVHWECPVCKASVEDCILHFNELSEEDRELYQDKSSEVRARQKREARECLSKRS